MTPQSHFMVLAPIIEGRADELRALLATMNLAPGVADPGNPLVPFGRFDRLHFARFVVVDAPTAGDIVVYGLEPEPWPVSLVFMGDVDGPAETFLAKLAREAEPGLRRIFSFCENFPPGTDLVGWMRLHEQPPSANYVNWVGRTVVQVREEQALHRALLRHLDETAASRPRNETAGELRQRLVRFVEGERRAGRLSLTPEAPTPTDWRIRNALNLVGVPAALVLMAPFLIVASPALAYLLRARETSDPDLDLEPDPDQVARLAALEDHDVANQFTVFGDIKPGRFRLWTMAFFIWLLDYSARHIYNRGYLTRVQTIHFARWTFVDERRRMIFASNYDGSVDSYMDDFINKVAWGINLVFSNGVGYPPTDWLVKRGARDEEKYKRTLRRHRLPTDVWYNAYPGLSVVDLARNTRIRQGLERPEMSDEEARQWMSLL